MSASPAIVRPWIKRELAAYEPGIPFEGLREPAREDVELAQLELELQRLDAEIAVERQLIHANLVQRLKALGIDTKNYRPFLDAPTHQSRGPMEGRVIRHHAGGQVLAVR